MTTSLALRKFMMVFPSLALSVLRQQLPLIKDEIFITMKNIFIILDYLLILGIKKKTTRAGK